MAATAQKIKKLRIEQEMTIYTAAEMKAQLTGLLKEGTELELDLSQVGELDTAGLQLLILVKHQCMAHGGHLKLTGHSQAVLDVLDMCNMIQFFGDPVVIPSKAH